MVLLIALFSPFRVINQMELLNFKFMSFPHPRSRPPKIELTFHHLLTLTLLRKSCRWARPLVTDYEFLRPGTTPPITFTDSPDFIPNSAIIGKFWLFIDFEARLIPEFYNFTAFFAHYLGGDLVGGIGDLGPG